MIFLGFGREKITPDVPVSMNSVLTGTEVIDDLYATCLAWKDKENLVLQYSIDLRNIYDPQYDFLAPQLAEGLGVKKEQLLISVTHNHSAPDIGLVKVREEIQDWYDRIGFPAMLKAGKDAIKDASEVLSAEGGKIETEKLGFVRRYRRTDGTWSGICGMKSNAPLESQETQPDKELRVVRFCRREKKDVILINFQTHAASGRDTHPGKVHADFVGPLRRVVESGTDALSIYLQGACGNVNCNARLPEDQIGWPDTCFKIGEAMGGYVLKALKETKPLKTDKITFRNKALTCYVNHGKDHLVEVARQILKETDEKKKEEMRDAYGLNRYEPGSILRKSEFPETREMPLSALMIGDLAMGFAPVELFDTCGKQFREASSYPMTFFCGYTNGSHNYMPSAIAFPHWGYEVTECNYVAGTGEMIALKLAAMLHAKEN